MLRCYNRGCGQEYEPDKNFDDSCRHHPGAPYFHDAYKGWSCCNKKSVDFTEFLSIKGCTLSKHSNVKLPEHEKPPKDQNQDKNEVIEVRAPIQESMPRPPVETAMTAILATVAQAHKDMIDNMVITSTNQSDVNSTGEIAVGTSCKNSGCTYCFTGTDSDSLECQHHSGVPIFHEGMKYWSCCQKKTADFAVFLAQKGCAYGQHKWVKDNQDSKVVECRYDWHQTATNVIVSIYAKKYHYAKSRLEVNPVRLNAVLVFPDQENAIFDLDLELRGIINVEKTSAHMYATKVEITMPKAEAGSWPRLDFPRKNLPPPVKPGQEITTTTKEDMESDDDCDLDDIENVSHGATLTELASTKTELD